jgi:hypothetical protein
MNMKTLIHKSIKKCAFITSCILLASCSSYLDVVPENTPTVEHAFANRAEAENYLAGLFSFLPAHANTGQNPALMGGDEVWFIESQGFNYWNMSGQLWNIARGQQGTNNPLANYFSSMQSTNTEEGGGLQGGIALFTAISDCNVFLENISKPYDLGSYDREWWTAEVKFLKAYFHFWLMRMYGPIPLIKENIPVDEGGLTGDQRLREPIADVTAYIVELLDDAIRSLPDYIENQVRDMGRPTKTIAKALKAQVLLYAASPLFNGGGGYRDYPSIFSSYTRKDGVQLLPAYDASRWQKAVDALKEAIDFAHAQGHYLYNFREEGGFTDNLSDTTIWAMGVRGAVTEEWNPELIWGDTHVSYSKELQRICCGAVNGAITGGTGARNYGPPIHIIQQFYTKNGIPQEEDPEWDDILATPDSLYARYDNLGGDEYNRMFFYSSSGASNNNWTAVMHVNREPRFYGTISCDNGIHYGFNEGNWTKDNKSTYGNSRDIRLQWDWIGGIAERGTYTGYLVKKFVHYRSTWDQNTLGDGSGLMSYPYPIIRLADLYLMYAEALNEVGRTNDAYEWIDAVRARSGLKGVVESWAASKNPSKPASKEGLREIIQRERLNELAFEGARFWDLRRWLLAKDYLNGRLIQTLNPMGIVVHSQLYDLDHIHKGVFTMKFDDRDYFFPIKNETYIRNPDMLQSPGWESN